MPNAALLLYPEALATSVTLPAEILHAAAQMSKSRKSPGLTANVQLVGLDSSKSLRLESGLSLNIDSSFANLQRCDLLILPAIWRHPRRVLDRCKPFLSQLVALYDAGTSICSVGTASALLAECGLLDDRPATTHWHDFERFAKSYPRVQLKRRHLITQSDRLYCVGSVNSIADFMVHKVENWYGDRVARAVEAQFSPEARQSFETAAFLQQSPSAHHDALIRDAQDFLQQHPGEPHTLASLAAPTGLSIRSFSRRFMRATGETAMTYLQGLRLREARGLLQHSDLPVADIAWRCGYNSPSRFTQVFRKATDLSPRSYRAAVRGKRYSELPTVKGDGRQELS